MKNIDIISIVNAGVTAITNHTLSPSDGYKVYKFRKAVQNAFSALQQKEQDILKEVGIENPQEFDTKLGELRAIENPTEENKAELAELEEKLKQFLSYRTELYNEDADLTGVLALPYAEWKKLQDENKELELNGKKVDILTGGIEMLLEDVLWKAPEE